MDTTLIFLHGFPLNATCWKPQVDYFKNKYKVFTPDLRGHGKALAGSGPWMLQHFVNDLKIYMDEHKILKAVLCGLSMGGYIALQFMKDYPERVSALVLCDTRADADSNEVKDNRYKTILKMEKEGMTVFAEDFSMLLLGAWTLKNKPQIQKDVKKIILDNKTENMSMTLGALASRSDSVSTLKNIKCPTLVLVGAEDKITSVDMNELMAKKIASVTFRVIAQAGHLSNVEQPQVFNEHLEQFLIGASL
ncbi:MAG: alpha/beta hydrolase [Bacteriovoracaceae bacterium]|nr:alpha/beta hydrolase [Bacteriovoracaceae bacterium]